MNYVFVFVCSRVVLDSQGLHVLFLSMGGLLLRFLRRIRRVFTVMDLLSLCIGLGWVFVWGVWVGA